MVGAVTTLAGSRPGSTDGIGAAARFYAPRGVAVDGAGNLYVTDVYTIRKVVVATGAVSTLAGTAGMLGSSDGIGAAARFSVTEGATLDGAGNLYVADSQNNTIRKVVVATGAQRTVCAISLPARNSCRRRGRARRTHHSQQHASNLSTGF